MSDTAAILAEIERALDDLRREMARAIRAGDRDLYVTLANRYGRLNRRWDEVRAAGARAGEGEG